MITLTSFRPHLIPFPHPTDINWVNIRERGNRPWKGAFFLNVLSIVVLLFLTTPAALLNVVSQSSQLKYFLSMSWIDQSSQFNQFLVKNLIPTLLVLAINELLLYIINLIVDARRHERFSTHQLGVFRLVFVYFLFNMLLIPGIAANVINNAYEFFSASVQDWNSFTKNMFVLDNGNFFFTLVLNSAGGAILTGLNVFYILFDNYLSPLISMVSKLNQRENERWMKDNGMLLPWGSNYGMILVMIGIGFVFQ